MKSKTVVWAYLIILSLGTILSLYIPKNEVVAKEAIVIPGDAIRLRILANSDLESDQALKRKVRDAVNAKITLWVKDLTSLEKAKTVINEKLPEIQAIAERVVKDQGSNQTVKVKFGEVQFPTKLYGQFLYPAGDYQAILITLGEGKGANWWCVLYPPLCFLDFSNGVAVSDGFEEKTAQAKAASPADAEPKAETESKVDTASKVETNSNVDTASRGDAGSKVVTDSQVDTSSNEVTDSIVQAPNQAIEESGLAEKDSVEKENTVEEKQHQKKAPVYTVEDAQPVKVKFFVVELWQKLFD
jgi:stage II sporulation protein R